MEDKIVLVLTKREFDNLKYSIWYTYKDIRSEVNVNLENKLGIAKDKSDKFLSEVKGLEETYTHLSRGEDGTETYYELLELVNKFMKGE